MSQEATKEPTKNDLMTGKEVKRLLAISDKRLWTLVKNGVIRAINIPGCRRRYVRSEIQELINPEGGK